MSEKSCPLPAVVRVTPSDYEVPDSDEEIPTQIEFLLSKLDKIKFVRVKGKIYLSFNVNKVIAFNT